MLSLTSRVRQPRSSQAGCQPLPARPRLTQRRVVMPRAKRGDEQGPIEAEADYDRETAHLAVRMLTARAASVVLQNIGQVDTFKAAWMQDYFQKHPPIEGNAFLAALYEAKPVYSVDPYSGATHYINPAAIANAVLATRETLAQQLAKTLTTKVHDANVNIMRTHLETHTYVSGTNNDVKPSFRQYRRRNQQQRQLQQ